MCATRREECGLGHRCPHTFRLGLGKGARLDMSCNQNKQGKVHRIFYVTM